MLKVDTTKLEKWVLNADRAHKENGDLWRLGYIAAALEVQALLVDAIRTEAGLPSETLAGISNSGPPALCGTELEKEE